MSFRIEEKYRLDEKKVFLAQKALYSLYFNKDKWHLRDQLLQSGTDNIYVFINDPVLGVNAQGVGENKIGLTLENIRTLLAKSDTKKKIKYWTKYINVGLILSLRIG